jgi:DNA-binding MarR family transcriptional regulator
MGIKIDIQKRKFRNQHHKAMVNILFTHAWIFDKIKEFAKKEDITPQQFNVLRILSTNGEPMSTLQLRERMLDRMSDTSRIVNRMIVKKLVKKRDSKKDKRLVEVSILPQGIEVLRKLDNQSEELDKILYSLTKKEADLLSYLLVKLRNHQ